MEMSEQTFRGQVSILSSIEGSSENDRGVQSLDGIFSTLWKEAGEVFSEMGTLGRSIFVGCYDEAVSLLRQG